MKFDKEHHAKYTFYVILKLIEGASILCERTPIYLLLPYFKNKQSSFTFFHLHRLYGGFEFTYEGTLLFLWCPDEAFGYDNTVVWFVNI